MPVFNLGERVYSVYDNEFGDIKKIDCNSILIYLGNGSYVDRDLKYIYQTFKHKEEVLVNGGNGDVSGIIDFVNYPQNYARVQVGNSIICYSLDSIKKKVKGCLHKNSKEVPLGIGGSAELIKICKSCGKIL